MDAYGINREVKWAVYEANVQAYRSSFLSSQSLFLAIGAIMYEKQVISFFVAASVALLSTWLIWFPIIAARTRIVDFYKFALGERFKDNGEPNDNSIEIPSLRDDTYVHKGSIREKVNLKVFGTTGKLELNNWRQTRVKLDICIPSLITVLWIVMILSKIHGLITAPPS